MEVLNISLDDDEEDTSGDEFDEAPEYQHFETSPLHKKYKSRENISKCGKYAQEFREWERPPLSEGTLLYSSSPLQAQPDSFRFLFLDSVSSVSKIKHPSVVEDIRYRVHFEKASLHTVIRLFGVARLPVYSASQDLFDEPDFMNPKCFDDRNSVSVCCNVHGFYPYFYAFPTKPIFRSGDNMLLREKIMAELNKKASLEIMKRLSLVNYHDFIESKNDPVVDVEFHELGEVKNKIYQFHDVGRRDESSLMLSVVVALPKFVSIVASILNEKGITYQDSRGEVVSLEFDIYEYNLTNNLRFLTDLNLPGCSWLELTANKYFARTSDSGDLERESHCQLELDVHYKDIVKMKDQPTTIPPMRVLSLDLESRVNTQKAAKGTNGICRNQIIQIGAVLATYGVEDDPIIGKAAFVLGTCDPLPNTKVLPFYDENNKSFSEENLREHEAVMLSSFRDFVIQMDPDIITGYNIKNFDLPYLINRADMLSYTYQDAQRFPFLGRLKKTNAEVRPIKNKNKRMFGFDHKIVNIQGRIVMDMFPLFTRHKIEKCSLKLKDVAKRHLEAGEEKDDVKYTQINGLQDGNSQTRNKLAKYCVQDSYLPVKLMMIQLPDSTSRKQNFVEYYFELSRLSGVLLRYLVNKSKDYHKYFKQVLVVRTNTKSYEQVQKNEGRVKYHPDSPSPKKIQEMKDKLAANATSPLSKPSSSSATTTATENGIIPKPLKPLPTIKQRKCGRMLFTDDDDD